MRTKQIIIDRTVFYVEYNNEFEIISIKAQNLRDTMDKADVSFLLELNAYSYLEEEIKKE